MRAGRLVLALLLDAGAAGHATAQDYDPFMSAHESMSQQQFSTQQVEISKHLYRNSASRRGGGATAAQARACAAKGRFRSQHSASHPQVRRLYGLCRGVGL